MFNRSELLVIFILMSLGNAAPSILGSWMPMVSSPYYHASAENNWLTILAPHIPSWLVPHDLLAIKAFFEGSPDESSEIPGEVWLGPVIGCDLPPSFEPTVMRVIWFFG